MLLLKPRADFYGLKIPDATEVLLLIEVFDSTLIFDQSVKLGLYRYGVAEYWVIDLEGQKVVTYREPAAMGYARKLEFTTADAVSPQAFPDITIPVTKIFART